MFKSKHSGWTWDLKRTPFGGGGGGFFGGIGDALASIDPGPSIGNALAEVDKGVNQIPGGWITVGGLAAGGLALAYAPEVMALAAEAGIEPAVAAEQLGIPAVNAATGEVVPLATTTTAGADAILAAPDVAVNLGGGSSGAFGSLNPALPAVGATEGTSIGMSGALSPGTVLGTGLEGGGAIGSSYAAGPNGLPATDFFGRPIPASSVNFGGVPNTIAGTTATTTNTDLAKLLKQGAGSGLSKSLGQLAQGANPMGSELLNVVRGNQNPFTYAPQQSIQNTKPDLASLASLLKQG
jgi:hypothetical protein